MPDAHLVLIGRGEEDARLRDWAEKRICGERIHFGGYQRGAALVDAYRALDVAVWLREGNDGACRGVLEAMACGLPMIVGNQGAPPELVAPEGEPACGRVVDPTLFDPTESPAAGLKPRGIARALVDLLGDESLRALLGTVARARAATFTPQSSAAATLAFWRQLRALPPVERDDGRALRPL